MPTPVLDRPAMTPRTAIAATVLADAPAHLDADAVEGVLDCAFSATEAACLNRHPLLEFASFREVTV